VAADPLFHSHSFKNPNLLIAQKSLGYGSN